MATIKNSVIVNSLFTEKSSVLTKAAWITFFAVLTAIGAQVEIPNQPVPFTLQSFFVLLTAAFLGSRNGAIAQTAYLAAGAAGIPVFAGASFGIAKLFGMTGGYLLSFPVAAFVVGYLISLNKGFLWNVVVMFAGMLIIFTAGTLWLNFTVIRNLPQAITSGFLIFSWWDILKITAAAAIYTEFSKRYRRL